MADYESFAFEAIYKIRKGKNKLRLGNDFRYSLSDGTNGKELYFF